MDKVRRAPYRGPLDALEETIMTAFLLDGKYRHPKPGAIVERMRPEVREQLRELTSDQTKNVRVR